MRSYRVCRCRGWGTLGHKALPFERSLAAWAASPQSPAPQPLAARGWHGRAWEERGRQDPVLCASSVGLGLGILQAPGECEPAGGRRGVRGSWLKSAELDSFVQWVSCLMTALFDRGTKAVTRSLAVLSLQQIKEQFPQRRALKIALRWSHPCQPRPNEGRQGCLRHPQHSLGLGWRPRASCGSGPERGGGENWTGHRRHSRERAPEPVRHRPHGVPGAPEIRAAGIQC